MRRFYKLLTFLICFFALFTFMSSPRQAHAAPLNDIFTSPDSLIVKIQERIEYFFAFNTEQKVIVLEKQAERRLAFAQKWAKEGDDTKTAALIEGYEGVKKKESLLLKDAPASVMKPVKDRIIEEQKTIEEIKDDVGDEVKDSIEDTQKTVIGDAIGMVKAKEGESKATEFAAKIADFVAPGVLEVVAPGINVIDVKEDGGGGQTVAP